MRDRQQPAKVAVERDEVEAKAFDGPFWRHPLVLPVYVPTFILAFCRGMLLPTLPLYVRTFDASFGLVGLVLASQGLGTLFGDVPAGMLFRRLGQRRSMLLGMGTLGLSTLAMSWARSPIELILYGFLSGLGVAIWNISRHAYLTDATPSYARGRAIALFGGINRIGTFLGPAVGGIIAAMYGYSAPFAIFGLLALITMIFPALFARETVSSRAVHRGGVRGHTHHLWQVLRENYRTMTPAGIGQLLAQMVRSGRNIIIPLYGADILGLDVQQIGFVISLAAAVDMSLFYPAGLIMDNYGRKFAIVPCFLIQGTAMALIPFTTGYYQFLAAALMIGFGNGLGSGTMMTLGADLAPPDSMGEYLGVWRLIGDTGQTTAPIVAGTIADVLGLYAATFVIGLTGIAAAAVFAGLVPETLDKPKPAPT